MMEISYFYNRLLPYQTQYIMDHPSILIVEDELIIAADLAQQLKGLGYLVCDIASSVPEARQLKKKHNPDLVLLDIQLEGSEPGIVFGKELREEGNTPFIYITSHYDRATVEEVKRTRPNGYLIKPFSNEDVYVAIEMAINNFAHRSLDETTPTENRSNPEAPPKLKRVIRYMHNNLHKKLTLPELAGETGWNMYYFARMFKRYLDETPHQYLLKLRMEKAKTLLLNKEMTLAQIAYAIGFESHSHFTQTFRKIVGTSPDQYRKANT